jgi:hypothetical protein
VSPPSATLAPNSPNRVLLIQGRMAIPPGWVRR